MNECAHKFIWRCINCSNHFANIDKMEGMLKQDKKCPKCKSINILTLTKKEIFIHCKCFDPSTNGYNYEQDQHHPYPAME